MEMLSDLNLLINTKRLWTRLTLKAQCQETTFVVNWVFLYVSNGQSGWLTKLKNGVSQGSVLQSVLISSGNVMQMTLKSSSIGYPGMQDLTLNT